MYFKSIGIKKINKSHSKTNIIYYIMTSTILLSSKKKTQIVLMNEVPRTDGILQEYECQYLE
jgi:hypothetical protein